MDLSNYKKECGKYDSKMGFIGFGKSANRYHLPYVMIRETLEVKTIFDLHVNEKQQRPLKEKA